MVGWSDLWTLYQASPPVLLFAIFVTMVGGWKYVVKPELEDLRATQDDHADDIQHHQMSAQERDILLSYHDEAVTNLKARVRGLEQEFAAEHGYTPDPKADPVNDSVSPDTSNRDETDRRQRPDPMGRGHPATDGGQPSDDERGEPER